MRYYYIILFFFLFMTGCVTPDRLKTELDATRAELQKEIETTASGQAAAQQVQRQQIDRQIEGARVDLNGKMESVKREIEASVTRQFEEVKETEKRMGFQIEVTKTELKEKIEGLKKEIESLAQLRQNLIFLSDQVKKVQDRMQEISGRQEETAKLNEKLQAAFGVAVKSITTILKLEDRLAKERTVQVERALRELEEMQVVSSPPPPHDPR